MTDHHHHDNDTLVPPPTTSPQSISSNNSDIESKRSSGKRLIRHARCMASPDGRYKRVAEEKYLGKGSFKTVWKAIDTEMNRYVAWNSCNLSRLSEYEIKKMEREVAILKNLSHPNILKIHDSWTHEDRELVFITPLCSANIKQQIAELYPIKLSVIRKMCREILRALIYLHTHDPPILHRDIKSENILISMRGMIRVSDFGEASPLKEEMDIVGTPRFMAPEIYDMKYDETVDVYAFGMVVLEMLTNETPYEELVTFSDIRDASAQGIPPMSLQKVELEVFRDLIEQCLRKSEDRPSCLDLLRHPAITGSQDSLFDFTVEENSTVEQKTSVELPENQTWDKYLSLKSLDAAFEENDHVRSLSIKAFSREGLKYHMVLHIPVSKSAEEVLPTLMRMEFDLDMSKHDINTFCKQLIDYFGGRALVSAPSVANFLREQLHRHEYEELFNELDIDTGYIRAFLDEGITKDQLSLLTERELETLIPAIGPRLKLSQSLEELRAYSKQIAALMKSIHEERKEDESDDDLGLDGTMFLYSVELDEVSEEEESVDKAELEIKLKQANELIDLLLKQNDDLKTQNANMTEVLATLQPDCVPSTFICPISQEIMSDPVVAGDGVLYEREAILEWLQNHVTSPVTGVNLPQPIELIPQPELKQRIDEFRKNFGNLVDEHF